MTPPSTKGPRRRLDVQERRAAILAAAADAYARTPYAEVSIASIAEQSGSSTALVHHYFGSKEDLYAQVVSGAYDALQAAQREAEQGLAPGVPVRDRVRAYVEVYLTHLATHPTAWAVALGGGHESEKVQEIRRKARRKQREALREMLKVGPWVRHDYALSGYFGFIDYACQQWVERGCPESEKYSLIDAALGSLEGALGDWQC